jgi:hypothetical protein
MHNGAHRVDLTLVVANAPRANAQWPCDGRRVLTCGDYRVVSYEVSHRARGALPMRMSSNSFSHSHASAASRRQAKRVMIVIPIGDPPSISSIALAPSSRLTSRSTSEAGRSLPFATSSRMGPMSAASSPCDPRISISRFATSATVRNKSRACAPQEAATFIRLG